MIEKHKNNNLEQQIKEMKSITYDKLSLNQIQFFCSYLTKIDPKDVDSRKVTFTLTEFAEILGLEDVEYTTIQKAVDQLLTRIITIKNNKYGFDKFHFFKKCIVHEVNGVKHLTIDAHDMALPLFFELKERLISNNVLNSKSEIYLQELIQHEQTTIFN